MSRSGIYGNIDDEFLDEAIGLVVANDGTFDLSAPPPLNSTPISQGRISISFKSENSYAFSDIANDLVDLQRNPSSLSFVNMKSSASANVASIRTPSRASTKLSNYKNNYKSNIEELILQSSVPIDVNETEEIEALGHRGVWANKQETLNWKGSIPITEYKINQDPNPKIIIKKSDKKVKYIQELAVRYLKPPTPPPPGEIIIQQEPNIVPPPAPPIIIRQQPPRPETPEPLVIREAPPQPPPQVGRKLITISGKRLPPPPRKVIIERLAPLPQKPQSILVERWLSYPDLKRRVIFQKSSDPEPVVVEPRNVIIQWEEPETEIVQEMKYLGVISANPTEYVKKYGSSLKKHTDLPDYVLDIETPEGLVLAANQEHKEYYDLEGDIEALKLIDLNKEGLAEYSSYLSSNRSISRQSFKSDLSSTYTKKINELDKIIESIFHSIDKNENGKITIEDAQKSLLKLNSRLDRDYGESDLDDFFTALDINNKGSLDLNDFKQAFVNIAF